MMRRVSMVLTHRALPVWEIVIPILAVRNLFVSFFSPAFLERRRSAYVLLVADF